MGKRRKSSATVAKKQNQHPIGLVQKLNVLYTAKTINLLLIHGFHPLKALSDLTAQALLLPSTYSLKITLTAILFFKSSPYLSLRI